MTRSAYPVPPDEMPVEPIDRPERLSQTLLKKHDGCPHSAYLYMATMGDARSHAMDRGTLAHACAETVMLDLIVEGEASMYAPNPDVPFDEMDEALSMQTTALVGSVKRKLESSGRVHIPHEEADTARVCTYHTARGLDVLPDQVLGLEHKFVLDLPCGWEISVKQDLIWTPEPGVAVVDDYKTSLHAPPDNEWNRFQVKVGALALIYGYPVEKVPCPSCAKLGQDDGCTICGGTGKVERRLEKRGHGIQKVIGRELYPRLKLTQDGKLQRNEDSWTRLELDEFMGDLDDAGRMILQRLDDWVWPARKGSWCNECPAPWRCPLADDVRVFEGAVEDREHASELWELALAYKEIAALIEGAVKGWAKVSGQSVVVGDQMWAWQIGSTTSVKRKGKSSDWEGLIAAITRSAELGEPFEIDEWIKTGKKNDFKKTKVAAPLPTGEVIEHDAGEPDAAAVAAADAAAERLKDERYGADAPW